MFFCARLRVFSISEEIALQFLGVDWSFFVCFFYFGSEKTSKERQDETLECV
jgi:hypothetical protein